MQIYPPDDPFYKVKNEEGRDSTDPFKHFTILISIVWIIAQKESTFQKHLTLTTKGPKHPN